MGSFDYTCCLTGIGISPGVPVYTVALVVRSGGGAAPVTPIVPAGTYDDYGRATGPIDPKAEALALRYVPPEALVEDSCGRTAWRGLGEATHDVVRVPDAGFDTGAEVVTQFIRADALDRLVPSDWEMTRLVHAKTLERLEKKRKTWGDEATYWVEADESCCFQLRKAEPQGISFHFSGMPLLGRDLWRGLVREVAAGATVEDIEPYVRTALVTNFLFEMRTGWVPRNVYFGAQCAGDTMRAQQAFYQTCADICSEQAEADERKRAEWDATP